MRKTVFITLGLLLLLGIGIFGYWTISPLFITKEVNDTFTPKASDVVRGPFIIQDTTTHPAAGEVRLVSNGGLTTVRYENYNGTNGPDLFVYLAKDLEAKEFIDLGRAKGNKGNINYEIPADVDVNEYRYVLTWCKTFGVLFDYAEMVK